MWLQVTTVGLVTRILHMDLKYRSCGQSSVMMLTWESTKNFTGIVRLQVTTVGLVTKILLMGFKYRTWGPFLVMILTGNSWKQ